MSCLAPDREMLAQFAASMFKHARPDGFVSLRAFPDKSKEKKEKAIFVEAIRIGDGRFLEITTERARQAAAWHVPAVFCPPVATFQDPKDAKTDNLFEGVGLSVECDQSPHAAHSMLEVLLGTPCSKRHASWPPSSLVATVLTFRLFTRCAGPAVGIVRARHGLRRSLLPPTTKST
jgi:hypothetical protein